MGFKSKLGNQFKKEYFGFYCNDGEKDSFYLTGFTLDTRKNRIAYLVYRILSWAFQFGWFLAFYIFRGIYHPDRIAIEHRFLTIWGYNTNVIYFTLSLIFAVIGFVKRHDPEHKNSSTAQMLRSLSWMLSSVCQTTAILIFFAYWTFLSSGAPITAFNIDTHVLNALRFIIERIIVGHPVRLLHFIYPLMFGILYVIFTLILHGSGAVSAIYPVLDWQNNPGSAAGYSVLLVVIGIPLVHVLLFATHCLRQHCRKNRVDPCGEE